MEHGDDFEEIVAYCCGNPKGDELPQVGSAADLALDIFHDVTAMPWDTAAAYLHHQMDDGSITLN
jgi:hypothetical protein